MCIHVHYNQGCILHLKVNVCKNNCDSKFTKIKTSNCNDNHSHTYINTYVRAVSGQLTINQGIAQIVSH